MLKTAARERILRKVDKQSLEKLYAAWNDHRSNAVAMSQ